MADITNFPNGVSSFGITLPASGIPVTYGKYFFVDADNGNDGNDGLSMTKAVKTIAQAYSLVTTNHDDVIVLSTNSSHTLTAMLDLTKNRVHFIGDLSGRQYGLAAKITMGVTTAVTDLYMVKNTGTRNTFTGIKFTNTNTNANMLAAVGEGSEYPVYVNCEFYDSTNLTSDTHAEMVLNADSPQFLNCTFGSLADVVSGDKVRPAILMTQLTVTTTSQARDVFFKGCRFWKYAGGTTTAMVKIASTNDIERVMEFRDCTFVANKLGSVPATAITSATLTKAQVILSGSTIAYNCTKVGTATGILSGQPTAVASTTVGIQAT